MYPTLSPCCTSCVSLMTSGANFSSSKEFSSEVMKLVDLGLVGVGITSSHFATFKTLLIFHDTDWLIGILIMATCNPHINPLYKQPTRVLVPLLILSFTFWVGITRKIVWSHANVCLWVDCLDLIVGLVVGIKWGKHIPYEWWLHGDLVGGKTPTQLNKGCGHEIGPPSFKLSQNQKMTDFFNYFRWATKKNGLTFHYTGWLIVIPIMVYYNPNIIG